MDTGTAGTYNPVMATYVKTPDRPVSLVKVTVYMYAQERQAVREQAARRGMAMSEYLKWLVNQDRRGTIGERS